jgi:glycosyltransferase involved in cell wall biosynthesis
VCGDAALFFSPDDGEQLARHIQALAGSQALRERLRARGLERAQRYTWSAATQKLYGIIAAAA